MFRCFPSIPQQLLNGFCSKGFFGNLFEFRLHFPVEAIFLGFWFPDQLARACLILNGMEVKVPQPLSRIPNSVFYYLLLVGLGLCCCVWAFSSCSGATLRCDAWASHCSGFSLWSMGSRCIVFSSCNMQVQ